MARANPRHAVVGALMVFAFLPGCREAVVGAPEVPEAVREQRAGPASEPAPTTPPQAALEMVDIDLTPYGLSAMIRADGHVEAEGSADGIVVRGDDGFELIVGRGSLDMTGEREELVRQYGSRFERFLTDSDDVVAWELSGPARSSYHFFASFEGELLSHHCRTGPDGAPTPQLIDAMVDICRSVTPSKS